MAPAALCRDHITATGGRRPTGGGPYNRRMSWLGGRTVVALDASGLDGVNVGRGLRRGEVSAHERVPLALGALRPDPVETSLREPAVVQAALEELLERLGRPARATLVLPMG